MSASFFSSLLGNFTSGTFTCPCQARSVPLSASQCLSAFFCIIPASGSFGTCMELLSFSDHKDQQAP